MTTCPCGATGFYNRRDLAGHLIDKHKIGNGPRALMLAQRIIDKLALSPEDCAVLGIEPRSPAPPPGTTRERQKASETRQLVDGGLPDDASLNRALEEAGQAGAAKRQRRARTAAVPVAASEEPAVPPAAEPAAIVTTSSPTTSSPTPDAGAAGESVRSQETPMAKADDCKVCARLTKKAGEPTKCKRHGGAGVKKAAKGTKAGEKKTAKPGRTAASPHGRNGLDGKVEKMLTAEKAKVTDLREQLATAEQRVQILTELASA